MQISKKYFFSNNNQLKNISFRAFSGTNLEGSLDLSKLDYLENIYNYAFQNTQLTSVTLPPKCRYHYTAFPAECKITGEIEYGRPSASEK